MGQTDEDSAKRLDMLQRDILRYLLDHPDAKDTAEGIMHWWLPREPRGLRASELSSALDALVGKGWLTVSRLGQATRVYGLERARRDEVLLWLES